MTSPTNTDTPNPVQVTFVTQTPDLCALTQTQLGLLDSTKTICAAPDTVTLDQEITAPGTATVFVYQDGIPFIASQLMQGIPPTTALLNWLDSAEPLLQALRQHRRSVLSISLAHVLGVPDAIRSTLSAQYGCVFRNDAPGQANAQDHIDPVSLFLATQVFLKSTTARRIQAELDALSWHSADLAAPVTPDPDTVFAALPTLDHAAEDLYEQERVVQARLVDQLTEDIENYKALLSEREEAQARQETEHQVAIARLETQLKDLLMDQEARNKAHHSEIAAARAAQADFRDQVTWAQDELSAALTQAATTQQELTEAVRERDAHITALYQSTSWKVTAPMRYLKQLFGKG